MKKQTKSALLIAVTLVVLLMASCQGGSNGSTDEPGAGVANPASVYCVELGYQLEIRDTDAGQEGVCIYPDGNECDEWDFLAGRCGQQYSFCQQNGGVLTDNGTNVGTCIFQDESTCDEYALSQGECSKGQNPAEGD